MHTSEFLTIASAIVPDRTAIVFEGNRFTYAQLQDRANRLANALSDMGVSKGDRVAVMQVNCNELVEAYFACAKLDALYVPLNFRAKAEEVAFALKDAEPKVLMVGRRYVEQVRPIKGQAKSRLQMVVLDGRATPKHPDYDSLLEKASAEERVPSGADEDLTILMYTAGTTEQPKGVMLTHESLSSYVLGNVNPADPDVEERNILTVPLYHIAGVQAVLSGVYGGRTLIVQRQFDAEEWMKLVERERVDRAMMVPTMLKRIIDHPDFERHDLSSLKVITYGAAPMPLEVIKRALRKLPKARFINAFGQTETASTITMLPPEDHVLDGASPAEVEKKLKRLGSIGKPLVDVEVRIVDEEGKDMKPGQVGEIVARGPRLMRGYWKRESATAEVFRGGWLHTGDLGYRDEDGYIYLAGRAREFIKRGGEMISPEEVEQVLQSHPAIDEAAVIGVQDEEWGERVRAIVALKEGKTATAEEIMEFCRKRLSSFKKPESVVFVEELPRNSMGKMLKRDLKERFGKALGPDAASGHQ